MSCRPHCPGCRPGRRTISRTWSTRGAGARDDASRRGGDVEHLQDRVAVVTGAASGLGLAMSKRFVEAGMKVVLADIEADRLDAAVRELRAAGHDASGVVTDVADADAVDHLAAAAFDTHGAVHVLCNNAGV